MEAAAPHDVVFSAGCRNSFCHPRAEVLECYAASRHWRTDRDGDVRLILGEAAKVLAWRGKKPCYWRRR
ncbi:hypothetical protein AGMMS50256_01250 [Betaproteobacteria bacterium]|nr:hypothetical protein AGMMS50256_01250 [Betaproteobacteria bacterium]